MSMHRAKAAASYDNYPGAGPFVEAIREFVADMNAEGRNVDLETQALAKLHDFYAIDDDVNQSVESKRIKSYIRAFPK